MKNVIFILTCCLLSVNSYAQQATSNIQPGAANFSAYLKLLKGKKVGVFANQTSMVGNTHLVDTLQKLGVQIVKIFGPEHGFRGTADAGEKVSSYVDKATGINVISLYGKKRKLNAEDVADIDILLFDIQDVGVRFYTYISSLQEYMESAVSNKKPLIILDRPNPNGHYVDGPVLDTNYRSFIGMQPVPIVYGLTMGEYAKMLAGEGWLKLNSSKAYSEISETEFLIDGVTIKVVKCIDYDHKLVYNLPVKPSPNIPDATTILLYPSTCLFEGTVLSEGRGTPHPFGIIGHPKLTAAQFAFTPVSMDGAKEPKLKNIPCLGWNIYENATAIKKQFYRQVNVDYLIEAYKMFPEKDSFFLMPKSGKATDYFFNKLAGNSKLMQQIKAGVSRDAIIASWQPALSNYKQIRKKYLLYTDF